MDTEALLDSKRRIIATADICSSDSKPLFVCEMALPKQNPHPKKTIWDAYYREKRDLYVFIIPSGSAVAAWLITVGGWGQEDMIESIMEDINNISTLHHRHKFNSWSRLFVYPLWSWRNESSG